MALNAMTALVGVPRVAGDEATARAVRVAAEAVTDFTWISRGDRVLIKPVCNSGRAYPATTDPVALRTMIALLREKGAGRVVVADMSGVQSVRFHKDRLRGSTRALKARSRMARAVEDAGAEIHAFEESGWDAFDPETPEARGAWQGPVWMPAVLREIDHVILMPRCARHLLAGATLGLKAAVGWWRHDSRLEYHRDAASFAARTADANTVPSLRAKQRLVLTSATRVLASFGPDTGHVVAPETGLVIASASVVAHDMVSLAWLIENRRGRRWLEPNQSRALASAGNRLVVHWLGDPRGALRTHAPARWRPDTIWSDPVLARAFETGGGVPRVELLDRDVPAPILQRLSAALVS